MSIKKKVLLSPGQTKKLAEVLAEKIAKKGPQKKAVLLRLKGDLGAGKTTFVQGFARGLGIKENILSPTFVIFKKFAILNSQFRNFYHIDCYRIKNEKELIDLGFEKIVSCPENIICVEWPEKIKKIPSQSSIYLKFKFLNKTKREITIENEPVFL